MEKSEICKKFLANPGINPETGKPIQKGKATYNRLLKMCEEAVKTRSPKSQRRVKDDCVARPDCRVDRISCKNLRVVGDKCKGPWSTKDILGKGMYGEIFNICDRESNCNYIIKVADDDMSEEAELQLRASKAGVAPRIFQYFVDNADKEYIIMEKIRGKTVKDILEDLIKKEVQGKPNFKRLAKAIDSLVNDVFSAIMRLHSVGIEHKDLHLDNIMYNEDKGELQFIDFGLSKPIENFIPMFLDEDYVRVINEFQSHIPFFFSGTVHFDDISDIHDKKNPLRVAFEHLNQRRENAFLGKF